MEEDDKADLIALLRQHFPVIKRIVIHVHSSSECPGITMTDFSRYIKSTGVLDDKVTSTRID